ncbi:seizure protein 6 homolog isoform X2 [Triplophysa rosa]|uniref:Seizure protein 6 n=1 Tax=Triplophysa rosa TaxID=992332 RepID=A0A9W7TAE6_TRIRA|nr:seizure protein 6 homolog isoform X2 [Triplophysa rosa]KAI7793677.1 putative seizure protein 6 [Triplophysa rosa]
MLYSVFRSRCSMCVRIVLQKNSLFVLLVLAVSLSQTRCQEDEAAQTQRGGESESEREFSPFTSKQVPPTDIQQLTTDAVPNLTNLRLLKLHAALLTKSFEGDQQFFKEAVQTVPTSPTSSSDGELLHPVPDEDTAEPTTATVSAATPLMSVTGSSVGQKRRSKSRMSKMVSTTSAGQQAAFTTVKDNLQRQRTLDREATLSPPSLSTSPEKTTGYHFDTPAECNMNFTEAEGYIEIPPDVSFDSHINCSCLVTVYLGYGVEIQVLNVSVEDGVEVFLEDLGGSVPSVLANSSLLSRGLVLRSSSNQISVRFSSEQANRPGLLLLRYRAFVLSCVSPLTPINGDISVTSLQVGGVAYFFCLNGYQLQGSASLTCQNASTPFWSGREPTCQVTCGGTLKNATQGQIISPGFPGNYSNNLTCHWVLEAPEGHRLHVHFEKVALAEDDDRLLIKDGMNIESPPLYDSYAVEYLPTEGVTSNARHLFVEFISDESGTCTGAAIRYEAFAEGSCYEPFVKYGNFSTSDPLFSVGSVVEFSCEPGYTLEQGAVILECVNPDNPQWNETEPACRAVCSGEISDSGGVVLSPNWPEAYDKGQDCIWGLHVDEDKRIMLDVQVLRLGRNDLLSFYDGDDLTANILGQYSGFLPRFRLYTSTADVTIQFQSDPASNIYGYNNGFVVHFYEVPRNDTCTELPEIPNGWKSTSHPDLTHGTVITYQCYPGFHLQGSEILMCQWDLTWSGDVPFCEKIMSCEDPRLVANGRRLVSGSRFAVGSSVEYICNKGYSLSGPGVLTCYSRNTADPKWSERLPKCVPERYEPCSIPGAPSTAIQSTEKAFFQAGENLSFTCRNGYELQGESTIHCLPGHPSQWSSSPPMCRASSGNTDEYKLNAAGAEFGVEGVNIAIEVLIPVAVVLILLLGVFFCVSITQSKTLQLPGSSSPPYDNMTEESAFDNPVYETGVSMDDMNLRDVGSHNTIVLS